MSDYILGLDLGTNSVGWAVVDATRDAEGRLVPTGLRDWGSWIMGDDSIDQDATTGHVATKRQERGVLRRARRNLRRKGQRRAALLQLLVPAGILPADPVERSTFLSDQGTRERRTDQYTLRARAVNERLDLPEFGKVLYHLLRHRAYLSTRDLMAGKPTGKPKEVSEDKEVRDMLGKIQSLRTRLRESNAATLGCYLAQRREEDDRRLTRSRTAPYRRNGEKTDKKREGGERADRWLVQDEFDVVWKKQSEFHPVLCAPAFRERVFEAIFKQRPLSNKAHLRGHCSFHGKHPRAARASLVFQRFQILQFLSSIKVVRPGDQAGRWLSGEERLRLEERLMAVTELTWQEAREAAQLPENARFREVDENGTARGRSIWKGNRTAFALADAIGAKWFELDEAQQESLVTDLLTIRDGDAKYRRLTKHWKLNEDEAFAAMEARLPAGFGQLCSKCLRRIVRAMESAPDNLTYDAALASLGQAHTSTVRDLPVEFAPWAVKDLGNPVVTRGVREAVRVVLSAERTYGPPAEIRLEMPRDLTRSNKQREKLMKQNEERWKQRRAARLFLESNGGPYGAERRQVAFARGGWLPRSLRPS